MKSYSNDVASKDDIAGITAQVQAAAKQADKHRSRVYLISAISLAISIAALILTLVH